jgi:hypothetical protein
MGLEHMNAFCELFKSLLHNLMTSKIGINHLEVGR